MQNYRVHLSSHACYFQIQSRDKSSNALETHLLTVVQQGAFDRKSNINKALNIISST